MPWMERGRARLGMWVAEPHWLPPAEDLEVDVESLVFGTETELLQSFHTGQEHSYSHTTDTWL